MPDISIIVPTFHEAANVSELTRRLFGSLPGGRTAELVLVDDDSNDGIEHAIAQSPWRDQVRLLVRKGERGLASAVIFGLRSARGRWLVVMDADLSHPPEKVSDLVEPLENGEADMVVGPRYAAGASTDEQWSRFRRANSRIATLLAKPFASVTDPMSGFFAISRETFDRADGLNPIGYKIGLEIMVKCGCRRVVETPIHFADRRAGQSKLTFAEQLRYVEHLSRLYDYKYPRLVPVLKFLIVTFLGLVCGYAWTAAGWVFGADRLGGWMLAAYWPAVAVNLLAYWRYVKQMKGLVPIRRPTFDFAVISIYEWITFLVVYWWAPLWSAFAAAFVTRFLLRKLAGHDIRGLPPRLGRVRGGAETRERGERQSGTEALRP